MALARSRSPLLGAVVGLAVLLAFPLVVENAYYIHLLETIMIYAILLFGLDIVVGGIILGIAETTTGFYLSTGYKDVPGLVLLLIVLAVRPAGLFGKTAIKKV